MRKTQSPDSQAWGQPTSQLRFQPDWWQAPEVEKEIGNVNATEPAVSSQSRFSRQRELGCWELLWG